MSFLKKLGSVVFKIIGIESGLMPLIQPLVQKEAPAAAPVVDKLNQAFNVVVNTEQMFAAAYGPDAKKGSDKLKAATPFVAGIIQSVEAVEGKKPKDEALFEDASTRLTSAIADILNSFGE